MVIPRELSPGRGTARRRGGETPIALDRFGVHLRQPALDGAAVSRSASPFSRSHEGAAGRLVTRLREYHWRNHRCHTVQRRLRKLPKSLARVVIELLPSGDRESARTNKQESLVTLATSSLPIYNEAGVRRRTRLRPRSLFYHRMNREPSERPCPQPGDASGESGSMFAVADDSTNRDCLGTLNYVRLEDHRTGANDHAQAGTRSRQLARRRHYRLRKRRRLHTHRQGSSGNRRVFEQCGSVVQTLGEWASQEDEEA